MAVMKPAKHKGWILPMHLFRRSAFFAAAGWNGVCDGNICRIRILFAGLSRKFAAGRELMVFASLASRLQIILLVTSSGFEVSVRSQTMLILWTVMGAVAGYTSARMYKLFKVRISNLTSASIQQTQKAMRAVLVTA